MLRYVFAARACGILANWRNVMRRRVIGWLGPGLIMLFPPLKTVATLELPPSHTLLLSPISGNYLAFLNSPPTHRHSFSLTSVTHYSSHRHRPGHAFRPITDPPINRLFSAFCASRNAKELTAFVQFAFFRLDNGVIGWTHTTSPRSLSIARRLLCLAPSNPSQYGDQNHCNTFYHYIDSDCQHY